MRHSPRRLRSDTVGGVVPITSTSAIDADRWRSLCTTTGIMSLAATADPIAAAQLTARTVVFIVFMEILSVSNWLT